MWRLISYTFSSKQKKHPGLVHRLKSETNFIYIKVYRQIQLYDFSQFDNLFEKDTGIHVSYTL